MLYLIISALFFILSFLIHTLWCRYKKGVELHITSFVVISVMCLFGYFAAASFLIPQKVGGPGIWLLPLEKTAAVLYFFLLPFYLVFYYSTMIDSPSRRTIALLKERGALSYEEISREITDEKFIMTRLNPLVTFGYVHFDGRYYRLSSRAVLSCRIINLYQKLLGRKIGG